MSFEVAYGCLRDNSALLCKTPDGKGEVYETGNDLLTIVLIDKQDFWTKTRLELGDEQYEQVRKQLMEKVA